MIELQLSSLPNLPQRVTVVEVASVLWQDAEVVAVWLAEPPINLVMLIFASPSRRINSRTGKRRALSRSSPVYGSLVEQCFSLETTPCSITSYSRTR